MLAHELTHTLQQGGSTIQRKVQFSDVGSGESSGFSRVNDIIARLNGISRAVVFGLSATDELTYTLNAGITLSNFESQLVGFIDNPQSVKLRLTNRSGRLGDRVSGFNTQVDGDAFTSGYVDVDDLLAGSDIGFQMLFVHFIRERLSVRRYTERIGTWTDEQARREFPRAHAAGVDSEVQIVREMFNDNSIRLINDSPSRTVRRVFRNCHGDLIRRRITIVNGVQASHLDIVDRHDGNKVYSDLATTPGSRIEDYTATHNVCPV